MLLFIDDRAPVQLVASAVDTVDRSGSYTFAGLNFGDDFSNRTLVAVVGLFATTGVVLNQTTVTIGGVAAVGSDSGHGWTTPPWVGAAGGGVWAAKPAGNSGSVVVNFTSGTATAAAVFLVAVTDVASATPFNSTTNLNNHGTDLNETAPLNVPSNGVIIAGCAQANNTSSVTFTGVTKRSEVVVDTVHRMVLGYDWRLTAQTGRTIGYASTGNVNYGMKAASFS